MGWPDDVKHVRLCLDRSSLRVLEVRAARLEPSCHAESDLHPLLASLGRIGRLRDRLRKTTWALSALGQTGKFCVSNQDSADKVNFQTLQFAAGLCQTELVGADGSTFKDWLSSGMSSVRSHWVGRNPSGMFIVEVKAQYLTLLRTNLGVSRGLCAMEDLEAPQWFVVLPHQCDLRVEIERLLLCLPQSAKISLMHGGSQKALMDRTDLGIGIQVDDAFFLQYARQEVLATWSGGNSILPATTDIAPKVGCFIVLGVEGEGGRRALVQFLWDMLKVECKVTYDMRSVDRLSMAAVEYPFSQEAERAVHELTRVATVVKVESVYEETDKTYSMQFCTDAAHAMYRNGASVVREEGGGLNRSPLFRARSPGAGSAARPAAVHSGQSGRSSGSAAGGGRLPGTDRSDSV